MLRLSKAAAGLSALWHGIASASPTPQYSNPHALVGYDASLRDLFGQDAIVPEIHEVGADELHNMTAFIENNDAGGVSVLEPFIPQSGSGRGTRNNHLDRRFIVGDDNRIYNSDTSYPFSSVGRLVWSNGVYCSGTLVGPRHVLTARHCIPGGGSGLSAVFTPGQNNGAPFGSARVQIAVSLGAQQGPCDTKADWAVVILDQRLGEGLGYFGVKLPDRSLFDRSIFFHQGYPSDRDQGGRPYLQTNTRVQSSNSLDCDSTGPFYSDTDTWGGQSGGPFWEQTSSGPYIWGALSISVSGPGFTYAGWASGNQMLETVSRLRSEYP